MTAHGPPDLPFRQGMRPAHSPSPRCSSSISAGSGRCRPNIGACYVGMSRLVDDRHWASDVVAGATLGIIVGRSVTWHGRNFYASPMLVPKGAGIMINVQP